jgi:hypothetical protein
MSFGRMGSAHRLAIEDVRLPKEAGGHSVLRTLSGKYCVMRIKVCKRAFAATVALPMAILTLSCRVLAEETDEGDGSPLK